jgi:hypothetical protein
MLLSLCLRDVDGVGQFVVVDLSQVVYNHVHVNLVGLCRVELIQQSTGV